MQSSEMLTKQNLIYATVVLVLIAVVFWIFSGNFKSEDKSEQTKSSSSTSTLQYIRQLGSDIPQGDLVWNVMTSENIGSEISSFDQSKTDKLVSEKGKYIRVRVKLTNNSDKDITLSASNFIITDSEGKEYTSQANVEIYLDPAEVLGAGTLKSKETKVFSTLYEVPVGTGGFSFVTKNIFSENSSTIPVGLGI